MGAAGDMLTAALLELLPQPEEFVKRLNGLGIPGVTYHREQAEKCGITGTHITVTVNGHAEASTTTSMTITMSMTTSTTITTAAWRRSAI